MNQCTFLGNLTYDPELRSTPNGNSVVSFGVAINKRFKTADGEQKEEVTFLDFEAWNKQAEFIQEYFRKGDKILVDASAKLDTWEDKTTSEKRSKVKFRVNSVYFAGSKKASDDE